jgi:catechol 2,3-dioxygenase-like lactoylglutathione lyase family enzyme
MNRRQLIQALGLTGTAALAASSLRNAAILFAAEGPSFPITTVNHLSISVADYAKARDWYVDLFNMRITWDSGKECGIEMGPADAPNGIYIDPGKPGDKASVTHIGFGIPDFWAKKDSMKAEMDRLGVKGVRPDGEAGWSCNTPSGYLIQPVPVKDNAMYPGSARPCATAKSDACVAGHEEGSKNLDTLPKPGGKGFKAVSFSRIVFHTPDIAADRDFFRDLWGMKVISDKMDGENPEVLLKFGENTLCLRKTSQPGDKPNCAEFSFLAEDFNKGKAEAELKRRGLNPVFDPEMGWVVSDPDGLRIGVTGKA